MVRRMLCVPGGYRHAYRQANQITCGRCTHLSCGLPFPSPPVLKHRLRIDRHPPGVGSLIDISNQPLGPVATRRCLSYRGGPPWGYPGQTAPAIANLESRQLGATGVDQLISGQSRGGAGGDGRTVSVASVASR